MKYKTEDEFWVYRYEHIDEYTFIKNPSLLANEILEALPILRNVKTAFQKIGWEGDGEFGVIWIPPFMMPSYDIGLYLWHVKQSNNGTSFLACSQDIFSYIDLEDFADQNKEAH